MNIYLTRHGLTEWNVTNKIQGQTDTPLSEDGKKQAEEAREKLKDTNIDVVISSPLVRAVDTAKIITKGRNLEILTDDRIKERCFGALEGASKDLLKKMLKEAFCFGEKTNVEGMEEFDDLYKRTKEFFEEIKEKYANKDVLIVFHAGNSIAARAYFEGYENKEVKEELSSLRLKNCQILKYEI